MMAFISNIAHVQCFVKKVFLKISQNSQVRLSLFKTKRLWHRYFLVHFAKFLKIPILEHLRTVASVDFIFSVVWSFYSLKKCLTPICAFIQWIALLYGQIWKAIIESWPQWIDCPRMFLLIFRAIVALKQGRYLSNLHHPEKLCLHSFFTYIHMFPASVSMTNSVLF